ncbi:MAG: NYN domain-containing protein [bacterium]|nr:NYN domain-containing protein [bacterium]
MKNSVAILWDAENVNPNQKEGLVEAILDYAKKYGQLSVAAVFANWRKTSMGNCDEVFAKASFQLIHVPISKKNSSDISLMTSGMEYLFIYPHIETFIIVTGDVDFRPLLVSIRRRGCRTIIICDARNASEDLLEIADEYFDYRTIIDADNGEKSKTLTKEDCYALLVEATKNISEKKGKAGFSEVKVRMLLLNEDFSEKAIGFPNWKAFVEAAKNDGIVDIIYEEKNTFLTVQNKEKTNGYTTYPFYPMLSELNNLQKEKKEKRILFTQLNDMLKKKDIDIKKYGYSRLKTYLQDAEKRDLVKIEYIDLQYYVSITEKGLKYFK